MTYTEPPKLLHLETEGSDGGSFVLHAARLFVVPATGQSPRTVVSITKVSFEVNQVIENLLADIQTKLTEIDHSEQHALDKAIELGEDLKRVRDLVKNQPGGFRGCLERCGLKPTKAYDYMRLAANKETVRSSAHSSIISALKALRRKKPSKKADNGVPASVPTGKPALSLVPEPAEVDHAAWFNLRAVRDERVRFYGEIDIDIGEFLDVAS